jgi:hypothetical protein
VFYLLFFLELSPYFPLLLFPCRLAFLFIVFCSFVFAVLVFVFTLIPNRLTPQLGANLSSWFVWFCSKPQQESLWLVLSFSFFPRRGCVGGGVLSRALLPMSLSLFLLFLTPHCLSNAIIGGDGPPLCVFLPSVCAFLSTGWQWLRVEAAVMDSTSPSGETEGKVPKA